MSISLYVFHFLNKSYQKLWKICSYEKEKADLTVVKHNQKEDVILKIHLVNLRLKKTSL